MTRQLDRQSDLSVECACRYADRHGPNDHVESSDRHGRHRPAQGDPDGHRNVRHGHRAARASSDRHEPPNIHVEDSNAAIRALALQFLSDFTHPEISADVCVRNFSDACRGKAAEFTDITNNRKNLKIDPAKSAYSITSVTINPARTQATAIARCEFTSLVKEPGPWGKPGDITLAKGNCRLTAVYESQQWWLCDSIFDGDHRAWAFTSCTRWPTRSIDGFLNEN